MLVAGLLLNFGHVWPYLTVSGHHVVTRAYNRLFPAAVWRRRWRVRLQRRWWWRLQLRYGPIWPLHIHTNLHCSSILLQFGGGGGGGGYSAGGGGGYSAGGGGDYSSGMGGGARQVILRLCHCRFDRICPPQSLPFSLPPTHTPPPPPPYHAAPAWRMIGIEVY